MEEATRAFPLPPSREALRRSYGRLAGILFLATAALSVPAAIVLDPDAPPASYLLTLVVAGAGVLCLRAPWERLDDAWLHVVTASGTVAVTASLIVFSVTYRVLYFVVLAYAAYVFESRRAIAAHALLASAGLLLGLAVAGQGTATLKDGIVFVPALLLVTAMIAYLNEQLAASRDTYRRFAAETIDLALRIRTSAVSVLRDRDAQRADEELAQLSRAAEELRSGTSVAPSAASRSTESRPL